jgi:hypothetical protein
MKLVLTVFFTLITIISCNDKQPNSYESYNNVVTKDPYNVSVPNKKIAIYRIPEKNLTNIERIIEVKNIYKISFEDNKFKLSPISDKNDLKNPFIILQENGEAILKIQQKDNNQTFELNEAKELMISDEDRSLFYPKNEPHEYLFPWSRASRYKTIYDKLDSIDNAYKKYFYTYHLYKLVEEDVLFYNLSCEKTKNSVKESKNFGLEYYEQFVLVIDYFENYEPTLKSFIKEVNQMIEKWTPYKNKKSEDSVNALREDIKVLYSKYNDLIFLFDKIIRLYMLSSDGIKVGWLDSYRQLDLFPITYSLIKLGLRTVWLSDSIFYVNKRDSVIDLLSFLEGMSKEYNNYILIENTFINKDFEMAKSDIFYKKTSKEVYSIYDVISNWFSFENLNSNTRLFYPSDKKYKYNSSCDKEL